MSQPPLPEISIPDGNSRFNSPGGAGFASWFAALRSSISVALVEVRNQAANSAASAVTASTSAASTALGVATAAIRQEVAKVASDGKQYTDETVHRAINVTGLALDADGTPYFSPGSMNPRVLMDPDGTIYFREL